MYVAIIQFALKYWMKAVGVILIIALGYVLMDKLVFSKCRALEDTITSLESNITAYKKRENSIKEVLANTIKVREKCNADLANMKLVHQQRNIRMNMNQRIESITVPPITSVVTDENKTIGVLRF